MCKSGVFDFFRFHTASPTVAIRGKLEDFKMYISGKALQNEYKAELFKQYVNQVLNTLKNEAYGLDLRQLACKARLSLSTVKQAIAKLTFSEKVVLSNGKYFAKV